MAETHRPEAASAEDVSKRFGRIARRVLVGVVAVATLVLTVAAAGVIAIAALAVSVIVALGVALLWLFGRFATPRAPAKNEEPGTLDARKGARGWTVEARRFSF